MEDHATRERAKLHREEKHTKELYPVTRIIAGQLRKASVNPRHVAYIDAVRGAQALADAGEHKVVAFICFANEREIGWIVQGTAEELTRYLNGEERRKF